MIAWRWGRRNNIVHSNRTENIEVGVAQSLRLLAEFQRARALLKSGLQVRRSEQVGWLKPPEGFLKLNCDASVRLKGFVGTGFVVRDALGNVVGARVDRLMGVVDIVCVEALAVRAVIQFVAGNVDKLLVEIG